MQADDQADPLTQPINTGFADLAPAEAPPAPTLDDLRAAAAEEERLTVERAAIKAAAEAEERHTVKVQETAEEPQDTRSDARKLNDALHARILEARATQRKAEEPKPPQPASQHIMDQTKREMAEGARQSKWHSDQRLAAQAGKPPPAPRRGLSPHPNDPQGNVEVFRPQDYVPDPVKNQGHVKVTS